MKIVTWNCNGKFREKFKKIRELDADIYVIQECEDPSQAKETSYKKFAQNYLWIGDIHYKGLGIFAKKDIKLELLPHNDIPKYFIPCKVDDTFNLLGIWTKKKYIEQIHDFYNLNKELFDKNLVICGDFNSNTIFDKEHRTKNHTNLVHILKKKGLTGAYHFLNNEKHGKEKQATFYLARQLNKPFHIDHIFTAPYIIKSLMIHDHYKWITLSDHLPIIFEIDESKFDKKEENHIIEITNEKDLDLKSIKRPDKKEIREKLNELTIDNINKIAKFHKIKLYGNKLTRIDKLLGKLPLTTLLQNIEAINSNCEFEEYVPKKIKIELTKNPERKPYETEAEYNYRINK